MTEREGVVKYQLAFTLTEPIEFEGFPALNYWRCYLYRLGLIGQDPARYEGLGYGNISSRIHAGDNAFLVSATQTGHMPVLCRDHYAHVTGFDLARNWLQAEGLHPPSSEALTHASIYAGRADVGCVMHVHCPHIWRKAQGMRIPHTAADVPYGTPQMAQAVQCLVRERVESHGVIAMLGHEDGLLIYGATDEEAGAVLAVLLQHGCE